MKRISYLLLGAIFIFLEIAQMNPVWANIGQPSMPQGGSQVRQGTLKDLPMSAQEAVSKAFGRDDRTYHILKNSKGFQAKNTAQRLAMDFNRGSVFFRVGQNNWGIRLKGIGREDYAPLPEAKPIRKANRLEYDRGPVREWYLNGPFGLEQGFTVSIRPWGKGHIPIGLELTMFGDLKAWVDRDQRGISLTKEDGSKVLRYGGLRAYDAAGKELETWLETSGSRLWVKVRDDRAQYPVTIDPLVQRQELTAFDGASYNYFGYSVSLSSDGTTALIGAYGKTVSGNPQQGAAYVFTRSGGVWSLQQELTASDGVATDGFGRSVSLSSDGNTALIGAYYKTISGNTFQGAAYVFTRSGGVWTQQRELTALDGAAYDYFGWSVSLSSDGNTALIGAMHKTIIIGRNEQGAAYVFTRSGSVWSQQQELTSLLGAVNDYFGYSVSLSSDGNTALIGARNKTIGENTAQGAAYVFYRSGSVWSEQPELIALDGAANDYFGYSVSLSPDGYTALIGACGKNSNQGAAYWFTSNWGVWSQQQELTASDGAANDQFGTSVSLSSDGTTALIGAYWKTISGNTYQGAAYIFTWSGGFHYQQQKLTASDGAANDDFGGSVSLSSDGNTALIGAKGKTISGNTAQGAAYVFQRLTAMPWLLLLLGN